MHARSGSSPTPSTPSDLLSGRDAAAPSRGARAGAANLYVHLTPADLDRRPGQLTWPRAPVPPRSRSWARPPPGCSTDWLTRFAAAGTKITLRPVLDLSPDPGRGPARPTRQRCAKPWCCAMRTASSPAAAATPGPATSTTSPSTSPWKTADHRAKPSPANLAPLCRTHHRVEDAHRLALQTPRPRQLSCGPHRPATSTQSHRFHG